MDPRNSIQVVDFCSGVVAHPTVATPPAVCDGNIEVGGAIRADAKIRLNRERVRNRVELSVMILGSLAQCYESAAADREEEA